MLWVAEYGWIQRARQSRVLHGGDLALEESDFEALLSLLEDEDLAPAFRFARRGGRDCLKVSNWVGLIRTTDGTQIEVLPKVSRRDGPEVCRELLVKMLIHLEDSPFREASLASLQAHDMPLFELLFRHFLEQVVHVVRRGIARTYVAREDNLIYLRGKLQLAEHIRRNVANAGRIYCEYDEYDIDRPVNRLVRGALDVVASLSKDPHNQQLCNELLFWFERVHPTRDHRLDQQRMQRDRMVQHYAKALPPCLMILERLNPLTERGPRQAISMLFPMERVFEDYVAAMLHQQLPDWRVTTQVTGRPLVEDHRGRPMFGLRPDLILRRGNQLVVADTKWKLIDSANRRDNYDISQADIYQLFGYCKRWLHRHEGLRELVLIYPKTSSFELPLAPFWYRAGKELLWALPFDLGDDRLMLPAESQLNGSRPAEPATAQRRRF